MPKQTHIYRDFSGGENTSANPRVIKQNELQLVSGAMVDEMGYLSSFYPPQRSTKAAFYQDFTYTVSPGRGLFYFKSDYSYVSGGNTADDGPYHYVMITDRSTGNISITDGTTKTQIADINILTPDFYVHNNIVRIGCTVGNGTSGGQKWFGPIGTSSSKTLLGHVYTLRWSMIDNALRAPFWGLVGRCHSDTQTSSDAVTITAPVKTDLAGTSTIADDSGVEFTTPSSHGLSVGDTVIISNSEYYSGSHTITAVDTSTTFKIGKTWLSVAEDETPEWRRKGEPAWFSGWQGASASPIEYPSVAQGEASDQNYIVWNADGSNDEIREITSAADNALTIATGTSTTSTFQIYPPIGTFDYPMGMNLDVYQSYGSDKGAWPPGEYEFGQSLVYEGNQESLIRKLFGDNVTIDANEVLYVRVLTCGIFMASTTIGDYHTAAVTSDIDPRLIGGRVYARKAGTGDNWILLVDADFRVDGDGDGGGTRLNLTDPLDSWNSRDAGAVTSTLWNTSGASTHDIKDNIARWRGFYSTQYTINSPSPFTYEAINGFSQDEPSLSFGAYQTEAKYKTSVLCNSRVFVANVTYYDTRNQSANLTKMGDAILYSPPNKMDTFPPSNRLDIAEGDGDEFTCLMESGGMLLAFKESTLYIVDVKNPNPAGWRLQGKFDGLGIKNTHSAVKVQSAVAFANNYGCWIYDNNQLKDLIQGKISVNQWQNWTRNKFRKFEFSGTATATTANKLDDSGGTFTAGKSNILEGDVVFNTTDGTTANITGIDSDTRLSLDSNIMASGENYYIESDTFGPNVGYDNISKKLIIVNDCQSISDSPRFYDLVTGAWTRGWDNAPDRTGAALKTGVSYFMDGKLHQDAVASGGIEWDTMNNSWTNFVTIPEATGLDSIGHNSAGTGAAVYVDGNMNASDERNIYIFAMKQKVVDYSVAEGNGDANANRTRYNIVTRDEDFGAPNNIKKIYGISIDYITETGDENFAFDIRYQINGGLVTSDIGREWLVLDSTNFISANDDGVGTAQGNSINTYEIRYPEFSVNAFQSPLKCYSIALQINNKNEESASSERQYFKIVSISIKYRIVGKTSQTDTSAFDTDTMVQSSS
tara:strand:+ start:380 stop:3679 length:3300 start_codon:yes stop_codon:yes gene_type:complete